MSGVVAEEIRHTICKVIDFSNQGYNRLGSLLDAERSEDLAIRIEIFFTLAGCPKMRHLILILLFCGAVSQTALADATRALASIEEKDILEDSARKQGGGVQQ